MSLRTTNIKFGDTYLKKNGFEYCTNKHIVHTLFFYVHVYIYINIKYILLSYVRCFGLFIDVR